MFLLKNTLTINQQHVFVEKHPDPTNTTEELMLDFSLILLTLLLYTEEEYIHS
jgi:hypothetical protein